MQAFEESVGKRSGAAFRGIFRGTARSTAGLRLRAARLLTVTARGHSYGGDRVEWACPDRERRIRTYETRAAAGLPLFAGVA
jgi:hypothetical protein